MQETDFITFQNYVKELIKGDEKGEAQIFLDHFFMALGYPKGLKGAGANCEFRIKDDKKNSTKFADLVWKPIVLIEMKKRDSDLSLHYQQAFDYWTKLVPNRPQYVILCNFDEFWIYDLNVQVYEPLEKVKIEQIHEKREVFAFMFPKPRNPIFNYNKEEVTEKAAYFVSFIYRSMINRKIEPDIALKYCMQMVLTMFAEDVGLLPNHIFTRLIKDLLKEPGEGPDTVTKSYDLISGLFTAMNTEGTANGGMYKDVEYFNGGLFDKIYQIELTKHELTLIDQAASYNWRKINPAIFGSLFEFALNTKERHKLGAHYTHEIDIKKIVVPVIVQPWLEKIENAETLDEFYQLLVDLSNFKVLDPACGSGNFLFIAYKEMKLLEKILLRQIREKSTQPTDSKRLVKFLMEYKYVTTNQFFGIDINPFAVELAKVTLMIAKELIWIDNKESYDNKDKPLPLDNLDKNISCNDALLDNTGNAKIWPEVDAIIGNPPYQSKNKMQQEFGIEYLNQLRQIYPEIPGKADFCVYWFYKTHQQLKTNCFAGLVGTSSIRQKNSRTGSLDYIKNNEGEIINAISTQTWSGDAAVSVSIVNWYKGKYFKKKYLYFSVDNINYDLLELPFINSDLKPIIDLTNAKTLLTNSNTKLIYLGQTQGHAGFLIERKQAQNILNKNPHFSEVLKPFLIGNDYLSNLKSQPGRYIIDFTEKDLIQSSSFTELFSIIEKKVLPERKAKALKQDTENKNAIFKNPKAKTNKHHIGFYNNWWHLSYGRPELLKQLKKINRYISCSQISLRPIFEFISSTINPSSTLVVFTFDDDYSFGILQSSLHTNWWKYKGSSFEARYVYITSTVWDTFPWPQKPTNKQIETIAKLSKELRDTRNETMIINKLSLRTLYRTIEKHGKNKIRDLHEELDKAVIEAYGFNPKKDILQQTLDLNLELSNKENNNLEIQKPGIPDYYINKQILLSTDCVCIDNKFYENKKHNIW